MDRSSVIRLIAETVVTDQYGVQHASETSRKVFCAITSVSLQEWSEGGRLGLNPQFRMTMFAPEYHGEQILEYQGERYTIYRTYYGRNDTLDLYVERRQGNV